MIGLFLAAVLVTYGIFLIKSDARAVADRKAIRDALDKALLKSDERDDRGRETIVRAIRDEFRSFREELRREFGEDGAP